MALSDGLDVLLAGFYDERGLENEDVDPLFASILNAMLMRMHTRDSGDLAQRYRPPCWSRQSRLQA